MISLPIIENKVITIAITLDTVRGISAYPTSGGIVVIGGEDKKVVYSIVADGIEVSLHSGQAELVSWSEVESKDGPFDGTKVLTRSE